MAATTPSNPPPIVSIDGSQGEGGGQILRNAIAYAAIFGKELHIHKIRSGRSKPGLKAQHLAGMRLVAEICGGHLTGDELNSQEVTYTPASSNSQYESDIEKTCTADTKTAGSICLLLQVALPCALLGRRAPCRLVLKGGTNATMAPQYDYWERVFWPTLIQRLKLPPDLVQASVVRRGYFPRGGGEVSIQTKCWTNKKIPPIHLTERGNVCDLYIRSFVAGKLPLHMAETMAKAAKQTLRPILPNVTPKVDIIKERNAIGSGSGILIVSKTTTGCLLAGSALGDPKKQARDVGIEAANELTLTLQEGGCVDDWLQDQLILFMALADGTSEILTGCLTLHTQTAISVAEQVCGAKFQVTRVSEENDNHAKSSSSGDGDYGQDGRIPGKHLIRCEGVSFVNTTG